MAYRSLRGSLGLMLLTVLFPARCLAQEHEPLPELFKDDFQRGIDQWVTMDKGWTVTTVDQRQKVLSQHQKESDYRPPFRSPLHIALVKDLAVCDFQIDVKVRSTHEDYNHRDVCVFFGFQNPSQFYYVHLGKQTDPHANQIFVVNNADRTKISLTTSEGTPWDDKWHNVRVTRMIESGDIRVFFDDMSKPVMTAIDKTLTWGSVGVGSFDDTSEWDEFVLRGHRTNPRNGSWGIGPQDLDKDGKLSVAEFGRYLQQKRPNFFKGDEFSRRIDANGDGFISQGEFTWSFVSAR